MEDRQQDWIDRFPRLVRNVVIPVVALLAFAWVVFIDRLERPSVAGLVGTVLLAIYGIHWDAKRREKDGAQ